MACSGFYSKHEGQAWCGSRLPTNIIDNWLEPVLLHQLLGKFGSLQGQQHQFCFLLLRHDWTRVKTISMTNVCENQRSVSRLVMPEGENLLSFGFSLFSLSITAPLTTRLVCPLLVCFDLQLSLWFFETLTDTFHSDLFIQDKRCNKKLVELSRNVLHEWEVTSVVSNSFKEQSTLITKPQFLSRDTIRRDKSGWFSSWQEFLW